MKSYDKKDPFTCQAKRCVAIHLSHPVVYMYHLVFIYGLILLQRHRTPYTGPCLFAVKSLSFIFKI